MSEPAIEEAWERLFRDQGALIVPDFPPGTEFGLDCMTHETGPRFTGVTHIPHGLHFVFYSHTNFPRQGFFISVNREERLLLRPWRVTEEEIQPFSDASAESKQSLAAAILRGELNDRLAPFNEAQYQVWRNVSQFVTRRALQRAGGDVDVTLGPGEEALEEHERRRMGIDSVEAEEANPTNALSLSYTDLRALEEKYIVSLHRDHAENVLQRVTSFQLDKSPFLDHLIQETYESSWSLLMGELQLSFLMFVLLYSFPALKQWKQILYTVCQCETFLKSNEDKTCLFLQVIFHQLKFLPEDFFEWEVSRENFLLPAFTALFSALRTNTLSTTTDEHLSRFEKFINKKFGVVVVQNRIEGLDGDEMDYECVVTDSRSNEWKSQDSFSFEHIENALRTKLQENLSIGGEQQSTEAMDTSFDINAKFSSSCEREEAKYSWRYPLLFEEMKKSQYAEDFIMTAMRVLDEAESCPPDDHESLLAKLRNEAIHFLENEVAHQG